MRHVMNGAALLMLTSIAVPALAAILLPRRHKHPIVKRKQP